MVDDAPLIRELGALFLGRAGHVVTAATAAEALELAHSARPDLIVSDLDMPEVDGAALCRTVRADPVLSDPPILVLTGADDGADRERALHAGASEVLSKPLERMTLLDTARRLMVLPVPRGQPRIDVAAPARLRQAQAAWRGTAHNLSRGGVFVACNHLVPARTSVDLRLSLPELGRPLASRAQVVWVRGGTPEVSPGMGMRFLSLDRRSAQDLANYVSERVPVESVEELS